MSQIITVANGDGIGPEIMNSVLKILDAAEVPLDYEFIEVGEKVYLEGYTSGIKPKDWDILRKNKFFLKAPITIPPGSGYKNLNVTIRKTLGLFANVRPCISYHPFVFTKHPEIDIVIIRENEEDLYTGIEYQQTSEVVESIKLVSFPGSEKIIRYAFEYARAYNRKKVTCMVKDNVMRYADGLFHKVFLEVSKEYTDIISNTQVIDIGSGYLVDKPEDFDVIVTLNLYGDIISDIVAQIAGSVRLIGSANIGDTVRMFEAIHGSEPGLAGKNIANPSGLLNASVMMLVHLGLSKYAEKIQNAWLKTIEDGIHTQDIYRDNISKHKVSTEEFTKAIIDRLRNGEQPKILKPISYQSSTPIEIPPFKRRELPKELVGVDIYLDWKGNPDDLGTQLQTIIKQKTKLKLRLITNRGVKVYPNGLPDTFCSDHWRCRFVARESSEIEGVPIFPSVEKSEVIKLISILYENGYDVIKTENLYYFGNQRGFSLGQGE